MLLLFVDWSIVVVSPYTGPEQSEGKHTTTDTGRLLVLFLLLEIYTEQTLQRHGPENASQRGLLTSGRSVEDPQNPVRPSINHADLRAQFSE